MHAPDTSRNPLQSWLVSYSILYVSLKTSFWAKFDSSQYIILSYLLKKEHEQERWETRRRRTEEIAYVYQNNKKSESITLPSK